MGRALAWQTLVACAPAMTRFGGAPAEQWERNGERLEEQGCSERGNHLRHEAPDESHGSVTRIQISAEQLIHQPVSELTPSMERYRPGLTRSVSSPPRCSSREQGATRGNPWAESPASSPD